MDMTPTLYMRTRQAAASIVTLIAMSVCVTAAEAQIARTDQQIYESACATCPEDSTNVLRRRMSPCAALDDPDFQGGEDRVRYSVDVTGARGPLRVEAQLWYQPIAHRWVENLRRYDAAEPRRFVGYFVEMAPASAFMLTSTRREFK